MDVAKLVTALLSEMKALSSTETVVGKPVQVGDATVIPVNRLSLGFGVGAGARKNGHGEGDGATALGGGVTVEPLAFIVVDGEGHAHLLPVTAARDSALVRAIEMLPEVAGKLAQSGAALIEKAAEHKRRT